MQLVRLGDVAQINPRFDKSSLADDALVSFVPMAAVGAADGKIDTSTTRPFAEVKKGSYTPFKDGDVLFAKVTPCMENGKMAVARGLTNGVGFGSSEFHVLRPSEQVDAKYLYYFVSSQAFRKEAASHMTGAVGLRRVPAGFLADAQLPLVPLDEQRRIVAEIEKQFYRLDEAVANLQRVKANLKRYKASVLKAAVEGRLVETTCGWSSVVLGDVAISVRNGCSVKPDAESGPRILRISAVRPLELDAEDVRFLPGTMKDYTPFDVQAGDVLFTRYNGSRDYVGVCAVVPERMASTTYPDKLIRVRVVKEKALPEFLAIACSAGHGRDFIKSKIRTTAGQSGVSGADIKSIPMRVPSLEDQRVIVADVDRRFSVLRTVEAEVNANILRAQALRQSVLASAFAHDPATPRFD